MGNGETKSITKTQTDELPKITHQRFANREILKTGTEEEVIQIKVAVPHQKEYSTWVEQLTKLGQQDFLLLPKTHNFKKEGFCGLSGVVQITYENYPFVLSDQIHNRYCLGTKFFEESELWYLVLTLLSAADYFHTKGKKVGDIRPSNVFISEDGSVKVACYLSWPMERTNYQKSFEKETTFISPEQMNQLGFGKLDPSSSFNLSQTFSIGLTLLDAATLSDSQDIYKSQKNLDYGILQSRLKDLQSKEDYSRQLRAIISNMCEVSHQNRTSCQQLYDWLIPYEEEINNFQQFEPNDFPEKIRLELEKESPSKTNNHSFNGNNGLAGYMGSNYLYQSNNPNTVLPPPQPGKIQYSTYVPSNQGSGGPAANVLGKPLGVGGSTTKVPGPGSGVGMVKVPAPGSGVEVGYQPGSGVHTQLTYSNNPPIGNSVGNVNFVSSGLPNYSNGGAGFSSGGGFGYGNVSGGVVESTYVPFSSKISLNKIDEQLQQSRKMFPS